MAYQIYQPNGLSFFRELVLDPDRMPAAIPGGASVGNCGHSGNRMGMGKPSQITHVAHMDPAWDWDGPQWALWAPLRFLLQGPYQYFCVHCGLGMGSMGLPTQIPGGPHPGSLSGMLIFLKEIPHISPFGGAFTVSSK